MQVLAAFICNYCLPEAHEGTDLDSYWELCTVMFWSASGQPFNFLGHTFKGKSNYHPLQINLKTSGHLTASSRPSPPMSPAQQSGQSASWLHSKNKKHSKGKQTPSKHFHSAQVAPTSISVLINVVQVQHRGCFKGRKKENKAINLMLLLICL